MAYNPNEPRNKSGEWTSGLNKAGYVAKKIVGTTARAIVEGALIHAAIGGIGAALAIRKGGLTLGARVLSLGAKELFKIGVSSGFSKGKLARNVGKAVIVAGAKSGFKAGFGKNHMLLSTAAAGMGLAAEAHGKHNPAKTTGDATTDAAIGSNRK